MRTPNPRSDFNLLLTLLEARSPFSFIRFSDGEMEVIRNQAFSISGGTVVWRKGTVFGGYPDHDEKTFEPDRDAKLRLALVDSAKYRGQGFFKGVPVASQGAKEDQQLMIEYNGGSSDNLTFADLLINSNYLRFLREMLPILVERDGLVFIGNHRANTRQISHEWEHRPIGDNIFPEFDTVVPAVLELLKERPTGSTVLCSASSVSNVMGHRLHQIRPDMTFIDVGTSLNPLLGLGSCTRQYQTQLLPWKYGNFSNKLKYLLFGNHTVRW